MKVVLKEQTKKIAGADPFLTLTKKISEVKDGVHLDLTFKLAVKWMRRTVAPMHYGNGLFANTDETLLPLRYYLLTNVT